MLESEEYAAICGQYRELTAKFYPGQVKLLPEGMNLSESSALFPDPDLTIQLEGAYIREADSLCYAEYPSFEDILKGFQGIRPLLRIQI